MEEYNYIYMLFFILLSISLFCLLFDKGDFLTPRFLISGTMTLSILFAMVQVDVWNLQVGIDACIAIIGGVLSFIVGGLYVSYSFSEKIDNTDKKDDINSYFKVNIKVLLLLSFFVAVFCYLNFRELYVLSLTLGNTTGYMGMIHTVRVAMEGHIVELSRWMNYRQLIAQMIAYFYIFIFSYNTINNGFKLKNCVLFLPIILYMPIVILTTGRMALMIMIIYSFVISGILFFKRLGHNFHTTLKVFVLICLLCILFVFLFLLLGEITGKGINSDRSIFTIISHYVGLSIPALNTLLNQPEVVSVNIGDSTFLGIYRILTRFGMQLPEVQIFLPFVKFYNIDTNVYTAIGRYVHDFGYTGMILIMWILGVIYTAMYEYVLKEKTHNLYLILYATYSFPLFLSSIDERFFLDIVGTSFVYTVILSMVLYYVLLKNNYIILNQGEHIPHECKHKGT